MPCTMHLTPNSRCFSTALPTETNVESGTSQSKGGTSLNLSNSGDQLPVHHIDQTEQSIYSCGTNYYVYLLSWYYLSCPSIFVVLSMKIRKQAAGLRGRLHDAEERLEQAASAEHEVLEPPVALSPLSPRRRPKTLRPAP